ncbi:TonB-dependent receptor plug domain-containing protein [Budvicia aquatica]|uniref:Colicin I receptor n=2 Tax=Budvicia aquatica TaxID=82979 RepID=A0A484ZPX0_9GAMM|nr:TonB-dependent receptor [Budvicia aquatica]VFS49866.1 Colicin I receptor precursor [Budvicia aquatica]
MFKRKNSLTFILPLLSCTSALADSSTSTPVSATTPGETMVISASRSESTLWESPVSMQVVDREELDRLTGDSVAEALRDIPGVDIYDNALAGRKQIRIRGEAPSRVLILIDGQEVTYQRSGQNSGPGLLIDESSLERIEVVKGPHSVLYGSQAIGGVVNFITKKGGDKPFGGRANVTYDSATNGWNQSGSLFGSVDNFDYRLNASYADHGDRDTPDGRLPNTGFSNQSQGAWLGYTLDKHKFGISLDRYELDTQTYFDDPGYQSFSVKIPKLERKKVGLFYDYKPDGDIIKNIHLDGYQQKMTREFRNNIAVSTFTGSPMIGNLNVKTKTGTNDTQDTDGLTFQTDLQLTENNKLIIGSQYQQDRVKQNSDSNVSSSTTTGFPPATNYSRNTHSNNRWEQTSWSAFGQNELKLAEDWTWTLGARQYWLESKVVDGNSQTTHSKTGVTTTNADKQTTRDNTLIAATNLRYSGFKNTELRLSYAQGYVFPSLSHLFIETTAGGGTIYGNPDLKAERSDNYEIGARYNGNQWYIDTAFYYSIADDYIASIPCTGNQICQGNINTGRTSYQYYTNANKATTYGLEMHAEYNGWVISPYLTGNLIQRELEMENTKTYHTGEPMLTGRFGIKHNRYFDLMELNTDLFIRAASGATDKTTDIEYQYPGWATANLAFTGYFGAENQYQVNLALNNLTDRRYQTAHESIPASGFNAAVGLGIKF